MLAPVPGLPTLPVSNSAMQLARTFAVPTVCCVWPMHQIKVEGFCVANIWATRCNCSWNTGDALDLLRRPLLDLLLHLLEAVDALGDEFLVLPVILQDVPHHAVEHRNVSSRAQPHIFGRVRCGARQSRIDDNDIRLVELGTLEQMLQRYRMRFRRIAAPDDLRLRVADVVEAVGHRAVTPGIGYAGDRRRMADARLMVGVISPPKASQLAEQIRAFIR